MSTLITAARVVDDGRVTEDAWLHLDGGVVAARGAGPAPSLEASEAVDAGGRWLTPGFVDVHMHGGGGADASAGPAQAQTALKFHRQHGTTRSVISLVTASLPVLERQLGEIAALRRRDPLLLGAHLEGPFLDPGYRGAHDPTLLLHPTRDAVDRLLEAADRALVQVTLAPELPGADRATAAFLAAGVVVAVGHTGATKTQAATGFGAGASLLTHAFNGMRGIHHRAPGPVLAATGHPNVTLEAIADNVHLDPTVLLMLFALAPDRVALVSDAIAAAGAPDGDYRLGDLEVTVDDGVARLRSDGDRDGALAGSTLTLDRAVRTAVDAGVPLPVAITAATATPAHAIGRPDIGSLHVGAAGDAVLLDDRLKVDAVWAAGGRIR